MFYYNTNTRCIVVKQNNNKQLPNRTYVIHIKPLERIARRKTKPSSYFDREYINYILVPIYYNIVFAKFRKHTYTHTHTHLTHSS